MKRKGSIIKRFLSIAVSVAMIATITVFEVPNKTAAAGEIYHIYSSNSPASYLTEYNAHIANTAYIMCSNNGVLSTDLKNKISNGNATFIFAPGAYLLESINLIVGNNSYFQGAVPIIQPVNIKQILYPDSTKMAVFETRTTHDSTYEASTEIGTITTRSGATNVNISNIALQGYTMLKLNSAKESKVKNVLINNYTGTYPNGQWANMGYNGATASLWLFGDCLNITIENCQIQFSSHHGFAIHTGDTVGKKGRDFLSKGVNLKGVRALYCGNGQLRGQTDYEINTSKAAVPETDGHGHLDWSVAFDLCENQSVENVVVQDCYALDGWKCGFYTEPEETGGHIKNLSFIRCRSDNAGQRTLIPNSVPRSTIVRETENANYFTQGAYFEDCISVNAEKCGWLVMSDRSTANPTGIGYTQLVRCIDMGSPISFVSEMNGSNNIIADGFVSMNTTKAALWLYGTNNIKFTNMKVLALASQTVPVVKTGYMLRQQFIESRNSGNLFATTKKYGILRANLTASEVSGNVYNLPGTVNPCEVISGSTFNGYTASNFTNPAAKIGLTRQTGTINTSTYVNDNWGRALYTVKFASNGGTLVTAKTAYAENTITAPTSPKKTAYTFAGWYTASTGGTLVKFPYNVKSNVTLYAHWKVAKPLAPTKLTATRIASKTIRLKWVASTKVAGYSIYRATSAYGSYKRITNTKYLTYTNKYLTAGKYYYYKLKSYRMSGTTKVYSNYTKYVRAKA
ncbi:MAG: InlB B-repeat-containing protein [Clostridia bacterium]|jgi:uncharacterized repeat protein (TIGR02543 family)